MHKFILACKTKTPVESVKRAYCEIYHNEFIAEHCVDILFRLIQQYNLITMSRLYREYLHPSNEWKYGAIISDSVDERTMKALISIIRITEMSKFSVDDNDSNVA